MPATRDNTHTAQDKKQLKSSKSTRSLRTVRTVTNNNNPSAPEEKKGSVLKAIRSLFIRASLSLSLAAHKLRAFADEVLSSDEVVNELFLVTSSSSMDSSLMEHEHEQASGHQEETSVTTGTNVQGITDAMEKSDTKSSSIPVWQDFDAPSEAEDLKRSLKEGEPFVDGDKVWEKRRAAWTACTRQDTLRVKQRVLDSQLPVPKENYPVIYSSLVEKGKTLKKPMNLKDALRVMNCGWIATKKWERAAQGIA